MDWVRQDYGGDWREFLNRNQNSDHDNALVVKVLRDIQALGGTTNDLRKAHAHAQSAATDHARSEAALDIYLGAAERQPLR
jgi:hypothetical protein